VRSAHAGPALPERVRRHAIARRPYRRPRVGVTLALLGSAAADATALACRSACLGLRRATALSRSHGAAAKPDTSRAHARAGVSLRTQELYALVFVCRYLDLFFTFISLCGPRVHSVWPSRAADAVAGP
jgi:hypothetical protein